MSITPEQREARRKSIGSSDIAAILGVHPFVAAADVWAEKVYALDEEAMGGDWIEAGNALEPSILAWAAQQLGGVEYQPSPATARDPAGPFHAHPDAIIAHGEMAGDLIEAKSGATGEWGEPWTDEVPAHVFVQCQWQMMCCVSRTCYVAAALASEYGIRMRMFKIERDDRLIASLREAAATWWARYVETQTRPGAEPPRIELLKRVRRTPGSRAEVEPWLIEAWADAKEGLSEATKHEKRCKEALLEAMGEAEGTQCAEYEVTYLMQNRGAYPVPATSFRVLRLKRKAAPEAQ